ncbi:MAG: ABC transporter permease [Betaproteobacteria bacterium RIFCSPLOWO2_02_64_14]|nr:MAG: ABC transporter permease [Betaproteobacteria bacterium RIFCSPLOWO2_02_64_14]
MTATGADPAHTPDLRFIAEGDGGTRVELSGAWNLRSLQPVLPALVARLGACGSDVRWDLRSVVTLDHAGAMLLWRAWGRRRIAGLELRPEHEALFTHFAPVAFQAAPRRRRTWLGKFLFVGERVAIALEHLRDLVALLGCIVLDAVQLVRHPARVPIREISANIYRTGAQALGITALVGFLIGVVLSYLSSNQLRTFGADVFIVNILGISIVRELGPVLAAILVAGRSGSAMTAQIGVMRVTEELDAMAVLGIPHTLRLILPKVIALAIALPLIVLWTNAMALAGGMLSAHIELGISFRYFLGSLPDAVPVANFWLGLGKGAVFGVLIALVACHFGLRIQPNTESLGIGTTNAVVSAITVVIIVDAVFAVTFSHIGIY